MKVSQRPLRPHTSSYSPKLQPLNKIIKYKIKIYEEGKNNYNEEKHTLMVSLHGSQHARDLPPPPPPPPTPNPPHHLKELTNSAIIFSSPGFTRTFGHITADLSLSLSVRACVRACFQRWRLTGTDGTEQHNRYPYVDSPPPLPHTTTSTHTHTPACILPNCLPWAGRSLLSR